jgi:hypothetical protein
MLGVLVETHRGLFYSPKGPRSRCSFLWKLQIAFCPKVHLTVRCTPDNFGRKGHHIGWLVAFHYGWASDCPLAHQTSSMTLPDRCHADVANVDHTPTVDAAREPLAAWPTGHVRCCGARWIIRLILANASEQKPESDQLGPASQASTGYVRCTRNCSDA